MPWHRLPGKRARDARALTDAIILGAGAVVLYVIFYTFDVHDTLRAWLARTEGYELDEFLLALMICGVAGFIYADRRLIDLRAEVAHRKRLEQEAHRLARHDTLTGLPNRRRFLEEFPKWTEDLPVNEICAVFIVDLDHFKSINQLHGHRLGDEVLRAAADRLTRLIGDRGLVARLGGDEFGLIGRFRKADEAMRAARRMVHEISMPIPIAALSIEVGVSVGVALYHPDEDGLDDEMSRRDGLQVEILLRRADMAMHRAKTEGRGAYRFFDRDMDERLRQRVQLEREIKQAITTGEILPYYQPLVDLASRRTIGYEVLARWHHPTRGILTPDVFVPIAEDTGLIGQLTYALLEQAIAEARHWPKETSVSINLSPRQFADNSLCRKIHAILADTGFAAHRLEIEITETAMVQRMDEAKATLRQLRALGVRIALDDFGTGYAGLYHLRELDLDMLKIDRSFISRILDDPEECKIVEAMIRLGRAFGLETTAEGIESQEMLDRLLALGCETGQGYLFGKPQPAPVRLERQQSVEIRRIA